MPRKIVEKTKHTAVYFSEAELLIISKKARLVLLSKSKYLRKTVVEALEIPTGS